MKKLSSWWSGNSTPQQLERPNPDTPLPPSVESEIHKKTVQRAQFARDIEILGKDARKLFKAGDKSGASIALKKRKQKEKRLCNLDNQLMNLEQTMIAIENASNARNMVDVTKQNISQMSTQMATLSVEDVEDVYNEQDDLIQNTMGITDIISKPFDFGEEFDDDIDSQMKEWEDERLQTESIFIENTLPVVPTKDLSENNNHKPTNEDIKKIYN